MGAEVSGRAFLGLLKHMKAVNGPKVLDAVLAAGNPATRAAFAEPIGLMRWYPYPAFVGFLRGLTEVLGRGNAASFCRELGGFAGTRDLGTVFRVYRALSSPERLIRACNKVWPSYYRRAGRMEAVTWTPDNTTLRIYDFKEMVPEHCRLMEGWMSATMRTIGFNINDEAFEHACMSRGDPYHEFRCTWERRPSRKFPLSSKE